MHRCPNCAQLLNVPSDKHINVTCPTCRHTFVIDGRNGREVNTNSPMQTERSEPALGQSLKSILDDEESVIEKYEEDFGEDLVDLTRRVALQEFSRGRKKLISREDSEAFGSDLIQLCRRGAQEILRSRPLISAQESEDFGDDLVEMVRYIAKEQHNRSAHSEQSLPASKVKSDVVETALHRSPFSILGASIRDDRRKIIELADEVSLTGDSAACTKARSDLTTPRNRLSMEIAWLPGVSPTSSKVLVNNLRNHVDMIKKATAAPALAKANLIASACEVLDPEMDPATWCDWIIEFAHTVDMISPEDVLREINEDRTVSGFPEIRSTEPIESELAERKRYFTEILKNTLNSFSSTKLVDVVTSVVEHTTASGEEHAPQLIHELVDRYEAEANRFLQPESENIKKLMESIRNSAERGEKIVRPLIDRLDQMARKWDAIAQPIQLSMKAQGLDHGLSHDIAWAMRSLAVDLFNKHDMLDVARSLNVTLQELFAELPAVMERLGEDSEALDDIAETRRAQEYRENYLDSVKKTIENIRNSASRGESAISTSVSQLIHSLRRCEYAGDDEDEKLMDDDFRESVAFAARSLAVDLFNKYDFLAKAQLITEQLEDVFGDLTDFNETVEKDLAALRNFQSQRQRAAQQAANRAKEITYEAEIGLVMKDRLRISPNGIEWKGQRIPLEGINSVRWGAVRNSVNGIPTGTNYTIAVGNGRSESVIETMREEVYEKFTECLWKAACGRLIDELLNTMKKGTQVTIGEARLDDKGIYLTKHKFWGNEQVYCPWGQVKHWNQNGSLWIRSDSDDKTYVELPYLTTSNAHLLDAIIRLSFKNWRGRLSGLLDD